MPAPKSSQSFEVEYKSLYDLLSMKGFKKDEIELPQEDEKAAHAFRARFYTYVRVRGTEITQAKRSARIETDLRKVAELEEGLARVRKFKISLRDNIVVIRNRDASRNNALLDVIVQNIIEASEEEKRSTENIRTLEFAAQQQQDNAFAERLSASTTGTASDDPFANYTIPQNPATPMGQTQDVKPGVSLDTLVHNTAERLRHGKIPKLSLPMSPEEQEAFLVLLRQEENLPDFTITQSATQLTLLRNATNGTDTVNIS